jgi:CheY-like chemotaxis protein
MKVLVAEDDFLVRMVLEEYLCDLGHDVLAVEDGQAALDMLRAGPFDLLLTDLNMPKMDGFELLHAVGAEFPTLACIVASGLAHDTVKQELARVRARVLGFAPKPAAFVYLGRLLAEAEAKLAGDAAEALAQLPARPGCCECA